MEPTNDKPTVNTTFRLTPPELERMEKEAERLGMLRTPFVRHCALIGLREVERAGELIESPVIGAMLQLFADLGPQETADEFKRIRHQLQRTDDSGDQVKFPFVHDNPSDLGVDCGLS